MKPVPASRTSEIAPEQRPTLAGDAGPAISPRRRFRNYLLDTGLQLRLASYLVLVATALSLGLGYLLWSAYRETSRVVALADPETGRTLAAALATEDRWRIVLVAGALAVVLCCLLGAAVVITHRIAGPAFALRRVCRQVADGALPRPRPMRSHDLLVDLAETVSAMVEALRERDERELQAVLRAAETLRESSASPEALAAVASDLERIAAEKEARLRS